MISLWGFQKLLTPTIVIPSGILSSGGRQNAVEEPAVLTASKAGFLTPQDRPPAADLVPLEMTNKASMLRAFPGQENNV
jgi:hypothetical protein